MSAHWHSTFVEGCYRCDLGRDEIQADRDELVKILLPFVGPTCTCRLFDAREPHSIDPPCLTVQLAREAAETVMREW